jgi:hypothetical protein
VERGKGESLIKKGGRIRREKSGIANSEAAKVTETQLEKTKKRSVRKMYRRVDGDEVDV